MTIAQLQDQVKATTDAEDSAVLLLSQLAQMLVDAKNDPAAIQALADQLKAKTDSLSAAIVANTPSA